MFVSLNKQEGFYAVGSGLGMMAVGGAAIMLSDGGQWQPFWLFLVLAGAVVVTPLPLISARKPESGRDTGSRQVDSGLLIIVMAAIFLGPAPAVVLAIVSCVSRWLIGHPMEEWLARQSTRRSLDEASPRGTSWKPTLWRKDLQKFRYVLANLIDYSSLALAAGLVFGSIDGKPSAADAFSLRFYIALGSAYLVATALNNFFLVASRHYLTGTPARVSLREEVLPTLRTHEATIIFLVIAAALYLQLGVVGLFFSAAALYAYTRVIIQELRLGDQVRVLRRTRLGTVRTLAVVLSKRDKTTGDHADRCVDWAIKLYKRLRPGVKTSDGLKAGFHLHDIGKNGIPDAILQKPAGLTDDEWVVMRKHTRIGYEIATRIEWMSEEDRQVILRHHERWDGTGYPDSLKGEQIPLAARVFSPVDAYDAMTSDRPYRKALPHEIAVDRLREGEGTQFDPAAVNEFIKLLEEERSFTRATAQRAARRADKKNPGHGSPKRGLRTRVVSLLGPGIGSSD